jgi:hypothetical protein
MKKTNLIFNSVLLALCLLGITAFSQQPNPPGQAKAGESPVNDAYLFAHMTHQDYGRLYYSVSLDGLHWKALNNRKRVFEDYKGHPDISKGHDGRYYIAGNRSDASPDINIWVSENLAEWTLHTTTRQTSKVRRVIPMHYNA